MNCSATCVSKKRLPACPYVPCMGTVIKNGVQNGNQRLKCKSCGKNFQKGYTYKACRQDTNAKIKVLLKEGCGVRSIGRILGISKNTVLSRLLHIAATIKKPIFAKPGGQFQMDELWSYVGKKTNSTWLIYAIERHSGTVIDFTVGNRSSVQIAEVVHTLLRLSPKRIHTDRLNIYPKLIPEQLHGLYARGTNAIERKNLTLRTHVKRLARKTICFSKNERHLEAHLRIYFWG